MTTYKKILAACDLSTFSRQVLNCAVPLAHALKAELLVVKVLPQREVDCIASFFSRIAASQDNLSLDEYIADMLKERHAALEKLMLQTEYKQVDYRILVRIGHPTDELIRVVNEKSVDLVVMGTSGKSNVKNYLFGSTAERMFRLCPVPLLSVRTIPADTSAA